MSGNPTPVTHEQWVDIQIALIKGDIKWLKWAIVLGFGIVVGIHFVDPWIHWGVLQFP